MEETQISLQAAIRRLAREKRGEHDEDLPAPETLVAYREGKLEGDAEQALQGHLALHPESAREVLDLASFSQLAAPRDAYRLSDRDVPAALAEMRERIRGEPESLDVTGDLPTDVAPADDLPGVVRPFPVKESWRLGYREVVLLAATVVAVAGAFWLGTLFGAPGVQPGAHYASVIDVAVTRGPRPYTVSAQAEQVLLVVQDAGLAPYARGELVLATEAGEVIRTFDLSASADADSLLYLVLPRDELPAGSYRLELFGIDAEGRQPVKEFRLVLDPAPPR